MKEISGGVCGPKGFMAGGIRAGIKAGSHFAAKLPAHLAAKLPAHLAAKLPAQKKDLALIYSQKSCNAAAMFTTNRVKAASVLVTQENIAKGKLRAVIANSGNANACTGEAGMDAARQMAKLIADEFSVDFSEVAVASTGVIGVPLPIAVIQNNIAALKASLRDDEQGHEAALEAIMTTDTRKKDIAVEIAIGGKPVRIGGMTKGSGMIHPNMATMLAFITTDAAIEPKALDESLRLAAKRSFNRLTVDGDTSTNDMVLIMANGEAGNPLITAESGDYEVFSAALEQICAALARKMARDGEGATKLITVTVSGASCEDTAEALAKSIVSSSLVKAACFGADANWGRVLCAMGYAGVDFDPAKTDVSFISRAGEIQVCKDGGPVPFSEEEAKLILSEEEIEIVVRLQEGGGKASVWGCDLTYDYVKINGDYRS